MSEIILFEHTNFHGAHKHVFGSEANLNAADDNFFNDKVSSIAVLSGNWQLYRDTGFGFQYSKILGPGLYPWVAGVDIKNDDLSSLKSSPYARPTVYGNAINAHTILFEHANFHGAHKHVFGSEADLNARDDNFFNDKVSSIVVLQGNWNFYRHSNFKIQYSKVLGLGVYPHVGDVDIENDQMSSLRPTYSTPASIYGTRIKGHTVLFEHINFHGAHKHVINSEANLNAKDDNFFNDRVSSLVVENGYWALYKDSNYIGQYANILGRGSYNWVGSLDIKNDDISSLRAI